MSADNWAICPRCMANAQAEYAKEFKAVMDSYGSIPVEEFDARRDALTKPDPENFRTFREDYEFYGAEQGEVVADYGGYCEKCGLRAELKESKRFYEVPRDR